MQILSIVELILLFGGGDAYCYGTAVWRGPHYGGGLLGRLVLIVVLVLWRSGTMGPGVLR